MNNMIVLFGAFLLLGGLSVSVGIAVFFFQRYSNPEPSLLQQRLTDFKDRGKEESKAVNETMEKLARLYKDEPYQFPKLGKRLESYERFLTLKKLILQAGMSVPVDLFLFRNLMLPLFLGVLFAVITPVMFLVGVGVAGFFYFSLIMKKGKRFSRFITQLPDGLSLVTTSLRAGHSFQAALGILSTELPNPIAEEFAKVVKDINLGIPVKEALERLALSMDNIPDIRMFVTAVLIQRESGGNLAEVLDKLSYTIRERFKLKGQIAALTGQARLTGYVLGLAPVVLLGGLSLVMYSYVAPLYETTIGNILLGVAGVMQIIGFIVMKKIVDIRV